MIRYYLSLQQSDNKSRKNTFKKVLTWKMSSDTIRKSLQAMDVHWKLNRVKEICIICIMQALNSKRYKRNKQVWRNYISSKSKQVLALEKNFSKWEFDPGSGRTLAACLTHASRTRLLGLRTGYIERRTGE